MLSHDTRLRCDLVDLYYTLYGTRRPTCLPIPETEGLYKPQKQKPMGDIKPKSFTTHLPTSCLIPDDKKIVSPPTATKEGPSDIIIDDTLECINVEIVDREEKIKVINTYINQSF